jgi:hypothetical protein
MTVPAFRTIRNNALIALLSLLSFASCEEAPAEFTRTERRMIDSLFQETKPAIDREVDSLCKIWADQHLPQYKDSLMRKRWAEIELILQSND